MNSKRRGKKRLKVEDSNPEPPKPIHPEYSHYRQSTLGHTLHETLSEMVGEDDLPREVAVNAFTHFDKIMNKRLKNPDSVKTDITNFEGELKIYRNCDNVWTFIVKDAQFVTESGERLQSDLVKIVACDGRAKR
eukprot:266004_1